eukprot:CAMPEP_0181439616 /NCGR_PEP_ID=MMETSP1110-20121109/22523_1 /TAXON_ID=174948 /ORGANISM="Symbiodinium sp., Strain CCMP421" /LENGTH=175 /DNA_ID=CAMNT_0023563353 /DNA_START=55 /DNA_END=582 /DNA_ORIENTATION=+
MAMSLNQDILVSDVPPGLPRPLQLATLLSRPVLRPPPGLLEIPQEPQWMVANPSAKFKSACGCALVSPPILVGDLKDVRVIFAPGKLWMAEYCRLTRKHKKTQVTEVLPKFGSLQLKFSDPPVASRRVFFLVGDLRMGPIDTCPGQVTTEVCELPADWRELHRGTLPIQVEIESA